MRNLLVFLARHYFFLLFLFLEILSVYFLVQHNYFQHSSAVSASNVFTGSLFKMRTDFVEYLDLKEQNSLLNNRIAELMKDDSVSRLMYTTHTTPVSDTAYHQRYEFLAARVIDNTVSERNNYLILDRGKLQGVDVDMGVICPNGVVGIVREVSDNYCVVMSVLHKDSKISASSKRDNTFGQLLWDGTDYREATVIDMPLHAKMAVGDTLITSGLGDAFPEGIPVGKVLSYEMKKGEKTRTVHVELTTDFRKVRHVLIVKNLTHDEVQQLRDKAGIENGQ